MDDFSTGPNEFYITFISSDVKVELYEGGYIFYLLKPLNFPNEWEVGIKQIFLRPPYSHENKIKYISPDNPDDKEFSNSFQFFTDWFTDNPKDLINRINSAIPQSLKDDFSITVDDDNYATLNIKNTRVKLSSDYLTDVLGFQSDTTYPNVQSTKVSKIKAVRKINIQSPIFNIETDFTVPEMHGSYNRQIICTDIFPSSNTFIGYKYEKCSYHRILKNYISSIYISLKDINNSTIRLTHPIFIKLHFRRSAIL